MLQAAMIILNPTEDHYGESICSTILLYDIQSQLNPFGESVAQQRQAWITSHARRKAININSRNSFE